MIDTKYPTSTPRHAMPGEFEDRPDAHEHNVHRIYARATEVPGLPGGMRLPMPAVHGVHRLLGPEDTRPLPRIEQMAHSAFEIAAGLGAAGAATYFARVDRDQCQHCQLVDHITCVRFQPRPDPAQRLARQSIPDACPCCAFGVLAELQAESDNRAPIVVEVWHPKAGA